MAKSVTSEPEPEVVGTAISRMGLLEKYLREAISSMVEKNIKLKYRRSWLGYVWSILNPLLIMLVMTFVFSAMFRRNIVIILVFHMGDEDVYFSLLERVSV